MKQLVKKAFQTASENTLSSQIEHPHFCFS